MRHFLFFMKSMVMTMDKRLFVIIKKELMRVFTDRRLVITVLILPAASIAIIYSIMGFAIGNMEGDRLIHEYNLEIYNPPTSFIEYVDDYHEQRLMIVEKIDPNQIQNSKQKLVDEEMELVLVFDDKFDDKMIDYKNAEIPNINTYYNPVNDFSQDARSYLLNKILQDYKTDVIGKRLGNLEFTKVYTVDIENDQVSVASESKITGEMLSSILPILISIFLFAGAMGIGIDMVAGEKERGTMSTILLTPVKRETVALGKLISLGVVAIIATFSSMMGVILSFPFSSRFLSGGLNLTKMTFTPIQIILLIISLLLLVGIYVGLIVLVSIISKSVKEAGSYISPIYMIVLISGVTAMLGGSEATFLKYFIPIYGNIMILQNIFSANINMIYFLSNAAVSMLCIVGLVLIIKKIFYIERFMFN